MMLWQQTTYLIQPNNNLFKIKQNQLKNKIKVQQETKNIYGNRSFGNYNHHYLVYHV